MADVAMWQDKEVRAAFEARARERLAALGPELEGQTGVVAIEPESGDYFLGATLGKADAAAFAQYPDRWVYFVRVDKPDAAIALPTW
jgi:glutathione S-transferase